MYPQRELRTLLFNKARLRRQTGRQRLRCVEAAAELAKPLEWIDRSRARWRQVSPVLKISALVLGFLARRSALAGKAKQAQTSRLGTWLRWGLTAFSIARGLKLMR